MNNSNKDKNSKEIQSKCNKIVIMKQKQNKKFSRKTLKVMKIEKNWKQCNNIINFDGFLIDLDYDLDESLYTITERARAVKQINDVKYIALNKITNTLEVTFTPQQVLTMPLDNQNRIQSVINLLKSKNDQNLCYLAQLIKEYSNKLQDHFFKEKFNYDVKQKINSSQQNLKRFQEKKQDFIQYLNQIIQSYEQPFFTYSVLAKNPETFQYDGIAYGFSEGLLSLLGTSLKTAPDIFMRLGVVDFIERKSRLCSQLASLRTFIDRRVQEPFKINIRTYDFISIPALKRYERIVLDENCPFEFQAFIHTYEIDDNLLLQTIEQRRLLIHNQTININNLDDADFIYTCQQEYFLEKYYNIKKQNQIQS